MMKMTIFEEIQRERNKQDKKWGKQNHNQFTWLAILMEEVGEASKELLDSRENHTNLLVNYRKELIQTGAVIIAMLESFDRNENMFCSIEEK